PATAAAASVAETATATASAPSGARGTGDLDLQRPTVQVLAVELLDGLGRGLGRRHLDEAESPRLSGVAVHHHRRRLDRPGLSEHLAQSVGGRREGQTSDEKFVCHREHLQRDLPQLRTLPGTRGRLRQSRDLERQEVPDEPDSRARWPYDGTSGPGGRLDFRRAFIARRSSSVAQARAARAVY